MGAKRRVLAILTVSMYPQWSAAGQSAVLVAITAATSKPVNMNWGVFTIAIPTAGGSATDSATTTSGIVTSGT